MGSFSTAQPAPSLLLILTLRNLKLLRKRVRQEVEGARGSEEYHLVNMFFVFTLCSPQVNDILAVPSLVHNITTVAMCA